MRSLRYLNSVLTVLAVLLSLNLYVAWASSPVAVTSEAQAQGLSNAGAQRQEMVDLLKQLNVHLVEVKKSLNSGSIRVQMDTTDSD